MCQSSGGPVQDPEAACLMHLAPQPALDESIMKRHDGTLVLRAPRPVKRHGPLRDWTCGNKLTWRSRDIRHSTMPISWLCNQCWSGLICSNPSSVTIATDAICPRSLWKCFSGTTVMPLKELRQFSTDWARSLVTMPSYSLSLTP